LKKALSLEQIMIQPRKQGIVYFIVVGALAVAIVYLLVYLFAIGSPRAIPVLLYLIGFIAGALFVYFAIRPAWARSAPTGRVFQGVVRALVAILGLVVSAVLPELLGGSHTISGSFARGLGFGIGLMALLTLLLPASSWRRNR